MLAGGKAYSSAHFGAVKECTHRMHLLHTAHLHYVAVPVGSLQFDLRSESVVSAQQDLKPESLCISLICTHFNQHVCVNQSRVPNGFDLIV